MKSEKAEERAQEIVAKYSVFLKMAWWLTALLNMYYICCGIHCIKAQF